MTENNTTTRGIAMEWFDDAPTIAHRYLMPKIICWLRNARASRVLDLGCGNGALTRALAREGFEMVGVDGSESGIARALAQNGNLPVQFRHAWLDNPLPSDLHGVFDAVIAAEVVEHLPQPRVLCERAAEALRPSGPFILTTPYHGYLKNLALALTNQFDDHWHPLRDGGHIKFFSARSIRELLARSGFEVAQLARVGRIPPLAKSMIVEAHRDRGAGRR